ncbi:MAG: hypothetical protein ACOCUI_00725 [bacterium]
MHVIIDEKEFEERFLNNTNFPFRENDTVVTEGMVEDEFLKEKRHQPLKRYRFENGSFKMEEDFIENDKEPTEEDYKKVKKLTDDEVIKLNISIALSDDSKYNYADYETAKYELEKRFNYFHSINSFSDRISGEMYVCPQIMCKQNYPLKDHIAEFEKLIPHFSYRDFGNEIGEAIKIDILEYTLSEYYVYYAYMRKDGKCFITKGSYGTPKEFENYKDLVKYIYEHLPYEKKNNDNYENDFDYDDF